MATPIVCPHCGQSPPPHRARPGMAVHCERCQRVFTPPVSAPQANDPFAGIAQSPFAQNPLVPGAKSSEPFVQPEMVFGSRSGPDVEVPNGASAFLTIFLIVGMMLVLCGGIGGYIAIKGRERIAAKADEIEQIQMQRQRELEAELKRRVKPKVIPPKPARRPLSKPMPRPLPTLEPTAEIKPQPPVKSEIQSPPPVIPPTPPTPAPEPPIEQPPPSPRRAGRSVDELLTELKLPTRPVWLTLHELARLPVEESRQDEVAAALDLQLRSAEGITATAAARAAIVWGTERNGDALLALIDSPDSSLRWEAMRALAKVRPTAETAELLLAQAGQSSNRTALRDALKDLGPVGQQTMLEYLESDDRSLRQAMLKLLGEAGTKAAVAPLEKMISGETDPALKSQAESALRRIQGRNP